MHQRVADDDRPPLTQIVGANVYRFRVLMVPKWTQTELGEKAGVSLETVRLVEQGRDPNRKGLSIRLHTLQALAEGLGVPPDALLRWDEDTRVFMDGLPSLSLIPGRGLGASTQLPLIVPVT